MTFDDSFIIITCLVVGLFFLGGAVALTAIINAFRDYRRQINHHRYVEMRRNSK